MAKSYRSEAARRMANRPKAKPAQRKSKSFKNGSNPHLGGSRSQSGQPRRGR